MKYGQITDVNLQGFWVYVGDLEVCAVHKIIRVHTCDTW